MCNSILKSFFILLIILVLNSCSRTDSKLTHPTTSGASDFISSHTSGVVSAHESIRIVFNNSPEKSSSNRNRIRLEPTVRGTENWIDQQTLVFTPNRPLKAGQRYTVFLNLGDVFDVPAEMSEVSFSVSVMHQDMDVQLDDIILTSGNEYTIKGTVLTADQADKAGIEKTLRAQFDGKIPPIYWPETSSKRNFPFEIRNINRAVSPAELKLNWTGSSIDATTSGSKIVSFPAKESFSLIHWHVHYNENPHIELLFSENVDTKQNLRGIIRLGSQDQLNTLVQGNRIRVFFSDTEEEKQTLYIDQSLRSANGLRLNEPVALDVRLRLIKPEVRLSGRGVIIPSSGSMLVPFESIGLGAVDVHVMRIFETNIPQFLQINTLADQYELQRVGKTIAQRTIALSSLGTFNPNQFSSFALDLSDFVAAEPGAVYAVTIGFRPNHRALVCPGETAPASFAGLNTEHWLLSPEEEEAWWENYSNFWWHSDYNWRERENPCANTYYSRDRWVTRNLLASNLGIIAKGNDQNVYDIFVTDLNDVSPRRNVEVSFYDFQHQLITSEQTNRDGHVKVTLPTEPFLVVANDGKNKGYLRLENGRSLSLSTFDVSGAEVSQGVKGFLYGERGVWRPGDSLFVSLIIEDAQKRLPAGHPVHFELRNPFGQLVQRKTVTGNNHGFYIFKTKTEAGSPTGLWSVTALAGGTSFTRSLRIETIRPNRLDIILNLNREAYSFNDRLMRGTLGVEWLHGAPASNLKTDISLSFSPRTLQFNSFPDYSFNDITQSFSFDETKIFDGELDEKGATTFQYSLPSIKEASAKLRGTLVTRVFENAGNYSFRTQTFDFLPYSGYVGLKLPQPNPSTGGLDPNTTYPISIVSVDETEKPIQANNLEVTVYELGWRWWWQQPGSGLGMYFSSEYLEPVQRVIVSTDRNGRATASINTGEMYGRILVKVTHPSTGHSSSQLAYVGYSWSQDENNAVGPARLTIRSDKNAYQKGETARITFPGASGARALVSIENGSSVLKTFWHNATPGENNIEVKLTPEMSPNIYAHIMLIQPQSAMANDLPIRMYGVIPIGVEDGDTKLTPTISVPEIIEPNSSLRIQVSEANNRGMSYTLAVVDEGLLSLTNFRTPDPHAHFFAREALGIKTWDMFDMVAGPFTGNMSRILAIGGDMDTTDPSQDSEFTRFKPVVHFSGPHHFTGNGSQSHEFDIPNYVGRLRVMVIAARDGSYGTATEHVSVRQELMVLSTLPRVLGPGEVLDMPVTVFTGKETSGTVTLNVEISEHLVLMDGHQKTVRLSANGQATTFFRVQVKETTGEASIQVRAAVGNRSANDATSILIRNPNPPVTLLQDQIIQPGTVWEFIPEIPGIAGSNSMILELSTLAPLDLDRRLRYLIDYPHGCLEQLVSSAFPQLYLSTFTELNETQSKRIQAHITQSIRTIQTYQTPDGSLSYWPGRRDINEWSTIYAFHFLVEAGRKGYHIPDNFKKSLESSIRSKALNWRIPTNQHDFLIQSYRLYTLALNGTPEMGAMNRLREQQELSNTSRWQLSAAYQLAGHPEAAMQVSRQSGKNVQRYREFGNTFGSTLRDQAVILEALSLMDRREEATELARAISSRISSSEWLSTQETAFALIAMASYLSGVQISDELNATFVYGSERGAIRSALPVTNMQLNPIEGQSLQVKNDGDGELHVRVIVQGTPLAQNDYAASSNLRIEVKYFALDGTEVQPNRFVHGTDIISEVRVTHPGIQQAYSELALVQIVPSGWEIQGSLLQNELFEQSTSAYSYQDIRDDRILTYFNLNPGETKIFRNRMNAAFAGSFYLPPISVYAMYDESVFARTTGMQTETRR